MDPITTGILGLILMLFLIAIGVPIAFSLVAVGAAGMFCVTGIGPTLAQISMIAWDKGSSFVILCVPLYILLGQLVFHTGIATDHARMAWVVKHARRTYNSFLLHFERRWGTN